MDIQKYVDNYLKNFKRYREKWNYEDGCVFIGALNLYKTTGEDKYLSFILNQLDQLVSVEGQPLNYQADEYNIDNINSGKVLFDALETTGDDKYKKALNLLREQLKKHPRNNEKSFWHKQIYPNQVWLDGLYMAMPFYAKYEKTFNNKEGYEDIHQQFLNVRKRIWDAEKQLYYHGYDESRKEKWCNKESGLSENFWVRAMGWFVMAMVDTLEIIEENSDFKRDIQSMLIEAIEGLLRYQDASGMWYQVIDEGNREGNYLETSGTLMIAYSILKGVRLGYLPLELREYGVKAFNGTVKLYLNTETMELDGICGVAGLGNVPYRDGSYEYYISEKPVINDHKGVGAFLMTYSEILKLS
ncbi:glycoside hydrolase family 88/105 protein [Alkaliphilus peptidifermentans]|uniref:Unsaturated rhamnogalacturonyl hydrolase n=1 Tax=Alkaliphilus peptidifermentans DSM 18978 TaxID=1120976 RepID=A0A1G5F0X0_9FIRM|nr:glycoside hydrolase family 88 protein [Alkaliphilus peptidifermentans]SCY32857.1 unsaturated rhamnogalacturonyl hydrolase [Alkaliphilus peptidifermentans DSM 18978]